MNKFTTVLIGFLSGVATVAILACIYLLKNSKPEITADTYIESLEQAIRKIKQTGNGNTADVKPEISLPLTEETKPADNLIDWFKNRKIKKQLKKQKNEQH